MEKSDSPVQGAPPEHHEDHVPVAAHVYADPAEFSRLLRSNFDRFDENHDGFLTKMELQDYLKKDPGNTWGHVTAATAFNHFDDIQNDLNLPGAGISKDAVDQLAQITDRQTCDGPSAGIIGEAAGGGAVGGGIGSKMSGDSFRSGAAKGAGIGALIGAMVWGVEEVKHKQAEQERSQIDSWPEFRNTTCGAPNPNTDNLAP